MSSIAPDQQTILSVLAITDTSNHYTGVLDMSNTPYKKITFITNCSLNQATTLRLFGSKDGGVTALALTNGYTITGGSGQPSDISLVANPGWTMLGTLTDIHDFLQWRVVASVAPNSGSITIIAIYE